MNKILKLNIHWSRWVKVLTSIVLAAIISSLVLLSIAMIQSGLNWIGVIISLFIFLTTCYYAISAPLSICVNEDTLVINKLLGKIEIDIKDIVHLGIYNYDGSDAKIIGSWGLFGFTGLYCNQKLGKYSSYVGDYQQAFFIELKNNKNLLVSSENRELVISTLTETMSKL